MSPPPGFTMCFPPQGRPSFSSPPSLPLARPLLSATGHHDLLTPLSLMNLLTEGPVHFLTLWVLGVSAFLPSIPQIPIGGRPRFPPPSGSPRGRAGLSIQGCPVGGTVDRWASRACFEKLVECARPGVDLAAEWATQE